MIIINYCAAARRDEDDEEEEFGHADDDKRSSSTPHHINSSMQHEFSMRWHPRRIIDSRMEDQLGLRASSAVKEYG